MDIKPRDVTLGREFKLKRHKLDLTQERLAELSGVGRDTISQVERGYIDDKKFITLDKIAKVLKLKVKREIFDMEA